MAPADTATTGTITGTITQYMMKEPLLNRSWIDETIL